MDKAALMPSQLAGTGSEWVAQWSMFQDDESVLFRDWITPATMEDFRDKDMLECGCDGGQHANSVCLAAPGRSRLSCSAQRVGGAGLVHPTPCG